MHTKEQATPTPWNVEPRGNLRARQYIEAGEFRIAECLTRDQDANAVLICRAVNSFDALVEALLAVTDAAALCSEVRYAGSSVTPNMWSDLYAATNKARAVLAISTAKA